MRAVTFTRRGFLRGAGATALAAGAVAGTGWAAAGLTPDARVAAAVEELRAALAAKHPGWLIDVRNDEHAEVSRHGVAVLAYRQPHPRIIERVRWFVETEATGGAA